MHCAEYFLSVLKVSVTESQIHLDSHVVMTYELAEILLNTLWRSIAIFMLPELKTVLPSRIFCESNQSVTHNVRQASISTC